MSQIQITFHIMSTNMQSRDQSNKASREKKNNKN